MLMTTETPAAPPDASTLVAVRSEDPTVAGKLAGALATSAGLRIAPPAVPPDVALVDELHPDAPHTIREFVASGVPCLALCDADDVEAVLALLAAGAGGCLPRKPDAAVLRSALSALLDGTFQIPAAVGRALVDRLTGGPTGGPLPPLTGSDAQLVEDIVAGRQFEIVFQPIVDLRSGDIIALESLARFTAEPSRPPSVWLQLAEDAGQRIALEHALLRAAVEALPAIPQRIALSANLSPAAAMDPGLAEVLADVQHDRVVLEITDHRQLDDYEPLSEALAALRRSGLRIAVDDSGQGLSSLRRVAQLAPDFMKLNRSLTRNVERDATKHALAYALAAFAGHIDALIIAEGLETEGDLRTVRDLAASYGQGYLLARPRPLGELDLDRPLVVPSATREAPEPDTGPRLVLQGVAREDFRQAVRAALQFLADHRPAATFAVAHLDYVRRRHTIVGSCGPLAHELEAGRSTALDETLCFHMAGGDGPRLCDDVRGDLVYGSVASTGEPDIASYMGVPLEMDDGTRFGSLFAVSPCTGELTPDDLQLADAAAAVLRTILAQQTEGMSRGERLGFLRDLTLKDPLTGVRNGPAFAHAMAVELGQPVPRRAGTLVVVEIEDLESLTEQYGRLVADLLLKDVASALTTSSHRLDVVGRVDEQRFGALLLRLPPETAVPRLLHGLASRLDDFASRRAVAMSVRAGSVALAEAAGPEDAWERASATAEPIR
jgi:EAL domain-containing protein (putative c-di-GMP-specific phosphodiesterase class I)/GGDEF domain-containing protein